VRTAASLAVLACGMTAALWLRLPPAVPEGSAVATVAGLIAGSLIAGVMIGRSRNRAALVSGLALLAAALWCLTAAPTSVTLTRLFVGALGLGAGMAFLAANELVWAAAWGNRTAALTLLNLPLPLGVLVNPALAPEAALPASAALATLALAFAAWAPTAPPPAPAEPETAAAPQPPALPHLALLLFLYAACEAATWNSLAEYWRVARVLDRQTAWLIVSYGLPLGLMAGRAASTRLLAAIAPLALVRYAGFAMAFATALMLLARSPSASCVAAFVVGLAMAPVLPAVLGAAAGALPRRPALGMAIALAAAWVGVAASAPALACIAGRSSLPTAMLLLPALSLGVALAAAMWRATSLRFRAKPASVRRTPE
jgi:fucose permease